ncbi:MAG: hypothetical protein IT373_23595 [Polyangiaceae bacterium]|nr:hypothetical protein [Polyangiaceae bacterium]
MPEYHVVSVGKKFPFAFARRNDDGSIRLRYRYRAGRPQFKDVVPAAEDTVETALQAALYTKEPVELFKSLLAPGQVYARMQRIPLGMTYRDAPPLAHLHSEACAATLRAGSFLVDLLRELFRHAEPSPANDNCFGQATRQLIVLACTEVEAGLRAALRANDTSVSADRRLSMNDYVRLRDPMRLGEWSVALVLHPGYPTIRPFESWNSATPTQSLEWYDAYNAIKHDRESAISRASLKHAIQAVAAAVVVAAAQFGSEVVASFRNFEEFSVRAPKWSYTELYVPPALHADADARRAWVEVPFFHAGSP